MKLINAEWYGCGCEQENRMGGKGTKEEAKLPLTRAFSSMKLIGESKKKKEKTSTSYNYVFSNQM